jgi:hypothetical protein
LSPAEVHKNFLDNHPNFRILGTVADWGRGDITRVFRMWGNVMLKNVLDAIRDGDWFFEPESVEPDDYQATSAIPGTKEKLDVLAERVRSGLPLWHESDRPDYDEPEKA